MSDREARKAEFVTANAPAREIYLDGYLRGFEAGFKHADESAEAAYTKAAQLLVRAGGAR